MTDEEMAEDYAITNWEWYEDGQRDYIAIKQAFLAGLKAGKDIAELEQEKCELLGIIQGKDKVIKDLKEENAKLKKEIEISQRCWQEQKNISLDTNCKLHKAKELLKWALHSDPEHDEDFDQKCEEAEQFLKEE